jgi:hypothetical protein
MKYLSKIKDMHKEVGAEEYETGYILNNEKELIEFTAEMLRACIQNGK